MPILTATRDQFTPDYGILCQRLFPTPGQSLPFGSTRCIIEPGGRTAPHQHSEGEVFYIARGHGRMAIAGEGLQDVGPGDIVLIPSHSDHQLENVSDLEELHFLSVYWEPSTPAALPKRSLLITAPPTPNGPLHLGHLSGPYLAADAYARHQRQRGVAARYVTGSDDHQSYMPMKARACGMLASEVTDHFADSAQQTLAASQVAVDYFLRPQRTPDYQRFVQDFFLDLVRKGQIKKRPAASLVCPACDTYLYEAMVTGICPHCAAPTSGNGCETCYHPNDCVDLGEPRCARCGGAAEVRTIERYVFPIEGYRDRLSAFHSAASMGPHLRALACELLSKDLGETSISHVATWGLPLPGDEAGTQVFFAWFEMAASFLYSAQTLGGDWRTWWKRADSEVVQFFGMDNASNFLVLLPALLLAYDPEIRLPAALLSNEFYLLEGSKFSTSRNHAVWGDEALASIPPDIIRLYLAQERPEFKQTNFQIPALREFVETELLGTWKAWFQELDARAKTAVEGSVPGEEDIDRLSPHQARFHRYLQLVYQQAGEAYSAAHFSTRRVAHLLHDLVRSAREFGEAQAFLSCHPRLRAEWERAIALELAAARVLAELAAPLMPELSAHLLEALGLAKPDWNPEVPLLPGGTIVGKLSTELFDHAVRGIDELAGRKVLTESR